MPPCIGPWGSVNASSGTSRRHRARSHAVHALVPRSRCHGAHAGVVGDALQHRSRGCRATSPPSYSQVLR